MSSEYRDKVTDVFGSAGLANTNDRRLQLQREQQEQAAERQKQLASQTSPATGPEDRIRIWERLHALKLPLATTHKLVGVIAKHTELSIQQVQEEQRRRRDASTTAT